MPNRLKSQRTGKGSHRFLATKNAAYDIKYRNYSDAERNDVLIGQVVDLLTDYGKTSAFWGNSPHPKNPPPDTKNDG